jgi:hypothetical protein
VFPLAAITYDPRNESDRPTSARFRTSIVHRGGSK